MEKDNKWGMFRNFMYNELGISKEDIRQWIKEAVHEEAEKMVKNSFDNFSITGKFEQVIKEDIKKIYYGDFKHALIEELSKKLHITYDEEKPI